MRRNIFDLAGMLLLCASVVSGNALAVEPETDVETVERLLSAEQDIARVSESAKERKRLEPGRKISFDEIMRAPNDVDLNFRYAQQQLAEGDFLGASGTLERILMIHPDLPRVRLLYSMVLYRLDNLKEAERELALLMNFDMPKELRENLKFQRDQIRLRRKATRWTIRQNLGYGIDDNRNAAPSSKRVLSEDEPIGLTGTMRKRRDTALILVTHTNVVHDLGFQGGHTVDAGFTYFLQEQTLVDELDLSSFAGEIGGTWNSPWVNIRPHFNVNHVLLSRESFLRAQGLGLAAQRTVKKRLILTADANFERQDYMNISENSAGRERKGPQTDVEARFDYILTSAMRVGSGVGFANKNAEEEKNAYEALKLNVAHTWLFRGGQYLINSVDSVFDYYDEVDTSIASRERRDRSIRYRVTYGAPLSFFKLSKILPKPLEDVNLAFTYEYYRTFSTITNYTYRNNKYQMVLSKTWRF